MPSRGTIATELIREALAAFVTAERCEGALLADLGVDPACLSSPRVPVAVYGRIWRRLALHFDDEFFGMDPRRLRSGSFAFLCRLCLTQSRLGDALELALRFLNINFESLSAQLIRQHSLASILLRGPEDQAHRAFTYFTYWLIIHGVACWLVGRRIPSMAVELDCSEPGFTDDYQVLFSNNLRFGQPHSRLIFAAEILEAPIRRDLSDLPKFLAVAPNNILQRYRDATSLAEILKGRLRSLPGDCWPTAATLAQDLNLSTATLRRRLAEQGQSYQALKDSVRRERAIKWLAERDRTLDDIAVALGFSDARAFHRSFRKWTGINPGHYRQFILADSTSA
ncbi:MULTISPECIES: AraC family transcriptional regulator [unclassified Pseudomonas]|uniref:AraC family transcriptional regulator n=1 Tax=unclassified Pseudomonas TaxID=196821 RepID=UPI0023603BC5|nr:MULTISPECIES: AraC family transcriptional regulator [unclassified Pseudomonas]